ncbi:ATP-binding protein, partial [Clostridioides difficile]
FIRRYMMEVYALVGSSGTGKSFKALEFAYENDIEYIIDDGILIYKNKVLAGISAKQANTTIEAVKRAIFYNLEHRQEVREAIKKENIRKILIIGTSKKMVNQIVERLSIGRVCKFINIQDISTKYEIEIAKQARKEGNHVIPVPAVEIKSMASGLSINSLKRLFRKGNNRNMVVLEKTIIRPTFSYIGKFYISADVIKQIIEYEVYNFGSIDRINKINIENCNNFMNIFVSININDLETIKKIEDIQQTIKKSIEKMTLVNVQKIDINIHKIKKINFLQC